MDNRFVITPLPVTDEFLRQKRLIQDRGEPALIEDGLRMDHPAYFSLKPGPGLYCGGRYHKIKTEYFCIIKGKARVDPADPETGEAWTAEVEKGQRAMVKPGSAHRFRALEELHVIEYYPGVYNTNDDYLYTEFDPS